MQLLVTTHSAVTAQQARSDQLHYLKREGNPYIEEPADYFAWHADITIEEVDLVPAHNTQLTKQCVEAAKLVYGLDRPQLRRLRFNTFESYFTMKMTLSDTGISPAVRTQNEASIARMVLDKYPYAGIVRCFERIGGPEDWIREGFLTV